MKPQFGGFRLGQYGSTCVRPTESSMGQGCMVGAGPQWALFLTTVYRVAELCSLKHCAKQPSRTSTHILR